MKQNIGIKVLREGRAEGTIIGGNLGTLLLLTGTPMMPDLSGAILCIEEDEVESPATVERMLTHLRQTGALAKINGMLIGRFHGKVAFSDADPLADVLLRAMEGFDFPVMYDLDFGHTDPLLTVPIGGHCAMDTAKKDIVFSSFIA
jgi:muramoyltetrapeptide carboxypeptidase